MNEDIMNIFRKGENEEPEVKSSKSIKIEGELQFEHDANNIVDALCSSGESMHKWFSLYKDIGAKLLRGEIPLSKAIETIMEREDIPLNEKILLLFNVASMITMASSQSRDPLQAILSMIKDK